uniref:Pyridoxalphosphate dependent aminotransferase class III n=1 Tax=uncultured bacterium pEAF66 TaxID=480414 RepID=B0LFU2_9BACT|nr:pyridoxalphosphate dependent aminotransferase class III [uncultured bacterium pEAF66]
MSNYQHYVKTHLSKLLAALGLDISYTRAAGDTLYYRDRHGEEIPVLDLLGGYGSLIFGHNHPQIMATATDLIAQQVPVHAQFSLRERAGELARRLSGMVQRESGSEEEFNVTFANSGAEAIEVAIKHAELDRILKLQTLLDDVTLNIERVQKAIRNGTAKVPVDVYRHSPIREQVFDVRGFEELIVGLVSHNTTQLVKRPIFLVLEKSFHGKLIGSVQLTYNKNFRRPFQYFGLNTRFISPHDPDQLRRVLAEERIVLYDLDVQDGVVRVVERPIPIFAAFLVEPIQGEGGVHMLDADFAKLVRKTCNELDCPLIVDEIQSGMGRSGSFLASTLIPLKGDYYTLSKSLGGGLAKISATLIRKSRVRKEFSLVHSSTFAEDDFSSGIALKVLDMLEADDGKAYHQVQDSAAKLFAAFERVRAAFPDVIKEVRGQGLFIGVEFHSQKNASSIIIRGSAYNDSFGYLLSGYLLHQERIRIAPPGSAPNVLRIEPSMFLSDAQVAHVEAAFGRLCDIVRKQDALHFVFPLTASSRAKPRREAQDFSQAFPAQPAADSRFEPTRPVRKIAFINHLINPQLLTEVDPSLAVLTAEELRQFVLKMDPNKKAAPYPAVRIHSPLGSAVDFILYPLCVSSEQMGQYLADGKLDGIRDDIQDRIKAASEDGCEIAGLGMFTSIVTNNCLSLRVPDTALTTGNAFTVAMAIDAIDNAVAAAGLPIEELTVVVVGAAGNIASTYASLLSEKTTRLILLGSERNGSLSRLNQTLHSIYDDTWQEICTLPREKLGRLAQRLVREPLVAEWLEEGTAPQRGRGKAIAQYVAERHGHDPYITVSTDRSLIRRGHIVLCAANSAEPFLTGEDFRENAIVCDIAVPNNVCEGIGKDRPDVVYQQGGIVATPNGESLHPGARAFLGAGQLFACMAETVIMGLAGINRHYSYGAISKQQVREIAALGRAHGFSLAEYKTGSSL